MNRILTFGLAAMSTALLSQPVYADKRDGGGGGAKGGGHAAAPAVHAAPAQHFATHAIAPQHFAPRSAPAPHFAQQAQFNNRLAPIARVPPSPTFTPSVAQSRSFTPRQRNIPSVAFGGTALNNNAAAAAANARDTRTFATTPSTQFANRGNGGFRVATDMSRNWDRRRTHEWNHHHYRWYGNEWVLFDSGMYGYPYGYYNNDYSTDYDQEPAPAMVYDSSQSIAESVQDQLAREGYNPGPVDGVIGAQTRNAIIDFQNDHHLPVTGQIDGLLLRAMGL